MDILRCLFKAYGLPLVLVEFADYMG